MVVLVRLSGGLLELVLWFELVFSCARTGMSKVRTASVKRTKHRTVFGLFREKCVGIRPSIKVRWIVHLKSLTEIINK